MKLFFFLCFLTDCLPLCDSSKMETTTSDYDYNFTAIQPCNPDNNNLFGARLAVLFYFMFLFSVLGNGLVLVIIYK